MSACFLPVRLLVKEACKIIIEILQFLLLLEMHPIRAELCYVCKFIGGVPFYIDTIFMQPWRTKTEYQTAEAHLSTSTLDFFQY